MDSGGSKEPCIRWGVEIEGAEERPIVKYREYRPCTAAFCEITLTTCFLSQVLSTKVVSVTLSEGFLVGRLWKRTGQADGDDASDHEHGSNCSTTTAVSVVDDGRINFGDFCKLMQQQRQLPGNDATLPERDTRQVFRVNDSLFQLLFSG